MSEFVAVDKFPKGEWLVAYDKLLSCGKPAIKLVCATHHEACNKARSARYIVKKYSLNARISVADREVFMINNAWTADSQK